jgi:hypothetical protein
MHSIAGDWGYDTKYRTEYSLSLFGITGTPSVSALAVLDPTMLSANSLTRKLQPKPWRWVHTHTRTQAHTRTHAHTHTHTLHNAF